jgi:hypothetical protein
MIERFGLETDAGLEAALADLGSAIDWPETTDVATAVGTRLRGEAAPRLVPGPRLARPRTLRRALLLAAALLLVAAGAVAAVRLGLDLLDIEFGPIPSVPAGSPSAGPGASGAAPSTASPTPTVPGARLGLGGGTTLPEARSGADFPLLIPAALGDPDHVFEGGPVLRGQVAFLYDARPDLPPSDLLGGAGLLVTQNHGEADTGLARKLVDAGLATVESVTVDGAPGYWISGQPHIFWYLAPDGEAIQDSRRAVGDTLVWERDGILYRIEGAVSLERALEIAASMS